MTQLPRAPGDKQTLVADLEAFPNWFCVAISDGERCKVFASHVPGDIARVAKALRNKNVALGTFNGFQYDDIILRAICADPAITPERVHALSQRIIDPQDEEEQEANFRARYMETPWGYSIDVFQLLNGKGSLKEHACRSNAPEVGESPYDFGEPLPPEGYEPVMHYCRHDCVNTANKLAQLWKLVILRHGLDQMFGLGPKVYALSEQGIAQATFLKLHRDRTGEYANQTREACRSNPDNNIPEWSFNEIVSKRVAFHTDIFKTILSKLKYTGRMAALDAHLGKWEMRCEGLPADMTLPVAGHRFQLGVGGLHSVDGPGIFRATRASKIIDLDVTSFYPSIIINEALHPKHIGPAFVEDMRRLRDKRVELKRAGDKVASDALKIVINATFGKLNDVWSPIRSVPDAMRVTVNGQMFLLMLIEQLHVIGAEILSANTDGVTIRWSGDDAVLALAVKAWENATGYELERTDYAVYARRDVNNYVAAGTDGKIKVKGAFMLLPHQGHDLKIKEGPDNTKGDGLIVKRAAIAFLAHNVPVRKTVLSAHPEELFYYQRCKNGGTLWHGARHLGKLARWYASTDGDAIKRQNPNGSWATLPNAHRAALCFNHDDIGCDIDFEHYVREADELVRSCFP